METALYWMWLADAVGSGCRYAGELLETCGHPRDLYTHLRAGGTPPACLSRPAVRKLKQEGPAPLAARLEGCRRAGIAVLTPESPDYPARLRALPDLPIVLYATGDTGCLNGRRYAGMVGTRGPTRYGATACHDLARALAEAGVELKNKRVLVLGAGGAGRMMAIEYCLGACDVVVAIRTSSVPRAEALAADIRALRPDAKIRICLMDEILPLIHKEGGFDLLCNATPVGMYPKTDAMPAQEEVIKACGCVFDAIYNPGRTRLLEVAQRHGIPTVGGMSMLVWQAGAAHEIWDGDRYDPGDIQNLTEEMSQLVSLQFGGGK